MTVQVSLGITAVCDTDVELALAKEYLDARIASPGDITGYTVTDRTIQASTVTFPWTPNPPDATQ